MEAEPHFSAPAQGVGAALRRREEGAAHRGVPGRDRQRTGPSGTGPHPVRHPGHGGALAWKAGHQGFNSSSDPLLVV